MTRLMRGKFPASHWIRIIPDYVQWALVDISEHTPFIDKAVCAAENEFPDAEYLSADLGRCSDAIVLSVQSSVIRASGGFDD